MTVKIGKFKKVLVSFLCGVVAASAVFAIIVSVAVPSKSPAIIRQNGLGFDVENNGAAICQNGSKCVRNKKHVNVISDKTYDYVQGPIAVAHNQDIDIEFVKKDALTIKDKRISSQIREYVDDAEINFAGEDAKSLGLSFNNKNGKIEGKNSKGVIKASMQNVKTIKSLTGKKDIITQAEIVLEEFNSNF